MTTPATDMEEWSCQVKTFYFFHTQILDFAQLMASELDSFGSTSGCQNTGVRLINTGESFEVLSPNYPNNYGGSDSCYWGFVITSDDTQFKLDIHWFEMTDVSE